MSVKRAMREIDSEEFAWWRAYDKVNPFGEERADLQIAQLCCLYANAHAKKGKRFKVEDFMPEFNAQPKRQSGEYIKNVFMVFAKAQNAWVKSKGKK